jgi:hypothetical protein
MAHFHARARTRTKKRAKGRHGKLSKRSSRWGPMVSAFYVMLPLQPGRSTAPVTALIIPAVAFMKKKHRRWFFVNASLSTG